MLRHFMLSIFIGYTIFRAGTLVFGACTPPDCNNQGVCSGSTCKCNDPFTGTDCKTRDYCKYLDEEGHWKTQTCSNHGNCIKSPFRENDWFCNCTFGYTFDDCSRRNVCAVDKDFKPYATPICHTGICTDYNSGHHKVTNHILCTCPGNRGGTYCDFDNPCFDYHNASKYYCNRRGSCTSRTGPNGELIIGCACYRSRGAYGEHCEHQDPCRDPKYRNQGYCVGYGKGYGGKCIPVDNTTMKCECYHNFLEGKRCEIVNLCKLEDDSLCNKRDRHSRYSFCKPCLHNGICNRTTTAPGKGEYSCNCNDTGYTGDHCEILKGSVIIIPHDTPGKPDAHVPTFEAKAGREHVYYLVGIEEGEEAKFSVTSGDGLEVAVSLESFRPIEPDHPVLSAVLNISTNASYYTLPHIYKPGTYNLTVILENDGALSEKKTTKVTAVLPPEAKCIPTTTLRHVGSTRNKATEYSRAERIVVEAILQFECFENESLTRELNSKSERFHYTWFLHKLSAKFPGPNADNNWELQQLSNVSNKFLKIEARTLLEGMYNIECRAYVTINGIDYGHSQLGYFRIIYTPPRIILKGGLEESVDADSTVILDASQSVDDSFPEDSSHLKFYWKCDIPCDAKPSKESKITIPPRGGLPYGGTVIFHLKVTSIHARTEAKADITLYVKSKASLSVGCVRGCDKFNPADEIVFHCNYTMNGKPGPVDAIKWGWIPTDEIFPVLSELSNATATVVLPRLADTDIAKRQIFCNATPPGLQVMNSSFEIPINTPPSGGNCTVVPASGKYLKTEFNISCKGFVDEHPPILYSFYVVAPGDGFIDNMDGRFLLGHDTNPVFNSVYLPPGNGSDNNVNVTIKIMDGKGLSLTYAIPVKVEPPAAAEYSNLFKELIYGNQSLMRKRVSSGDNQGALQLQMIATYGVHRKDVKDAITADERLILLDIIETDLLESPMPSFKGLEQKMQTMHIMDHVEERPDPDVLTNVSKVLFQTAAKLAEFANDETETTPRLEVDRLAKAAADSSSRLMKAGIALGYEPLINQPEYFQHVNQRDVLDFDPNDTAHRDYFFNVHDVEDTFVDEGFDEVAETAEVDVKKYAKVAHHAIRAMEHVMDAGVGHLGYSKKFDTINDNVSLHAEILPDVRSEFNLTLQPTIKMKDGHQVDIHIPNGTLTAIHETLDAKHADVEFQVILINSNPFFDDTSAAPHAPILSIMLKDSETHVPIIVKKLPEPIELTFPFTQSLSEMEVEGGMTELRKILVVPPNDIDDLTEIAAFKINLPYNSMVQITIQDPSSQTLGFGMAAVKNRKPRLADFCTSIVNVSEDGLRGFFLTETLSLNKPAKEPFLEYQVGLIGFDPIYPHTIQAFSVIFTRPSCLFRDEDRKFWSEEGCMIKPDSVIFSGGSYSTRVPTPREMTCLCNHFSIFSAVQFVIPVTVENTSIFTDVTVDEIHTNPVVLITVCIILGLYLIALLVCLVFDQRDASKDIVLTIMSDLAVGPNLHFYVISVLTGCNFFAGTTSAIGMAIYGTNGRSKPIVLKDKTNDVFRRGGFDTFLISDKDLGDIEKIRIWSDYTGYDPDWYCRKILIRCVTTGIVWYFFINSWLMVTEDSSTVIIEVPATTEEVPKKFRQRYTENIMEHFNNVNLWFSVFRYSYANTFTRCQRISCAFGVLTSYLFINILFHGTPTEDEDGIFEFGEYKIDTYAMIKGLVVVVLSLPFGIILVALFRYIIPRDAPTIIFWDNVVPVEHIGRNFFIPKLILDDNKKRENDKRASLIDPPKHVQIEQDGVPDVFTFEKSFSDEESESEALKPHVVPHDIVSTASTGTISQFSIPSTDVPALEEKIEATTNTNAEGRRKSEEVPQNTDEEEEEEEEEDDFEYVFEPYVYAVESEREMENQPDNMFRLGRRAMIESYRDVEPRAFIFQGENSIASIEELIEKQLQEAANVAKERKERKDMKQEMKKLKKKLDAEPKIGIVENKEEITEEINEIIEQQLEKIERQKPEEIVETPREEIIEEKLEDPKKEEKKEEEKKGEMKPDLAEVPWKRVTEDYLKNIDMELERELERKKYVQDAGNWLPRTVVEVCYLPRFTKPECSWPWYFIYVAWVVCLATICTTSTFTVLFGIHYGYLRSMQWLDTYIESFIISVVLIQPISGSMLTLLATLMGKDTKVKERVQIQWLDITDPSFPEQRKPCPYNVLKAVGGLRPPESNEIFKLSIEAKRKKELRSKLVRLILNLLLMIPLVAVSHAGHNKDNFVIANNIRKMFKVNPLGEPNSQFKSEEMVSKYLREVVVANLHPTKLYNGENVPSDMVSFLADQQNLLVGVARIRQQRVKPGQCSTGGLEGSLTPAKIRCSRSRAFKGSTQDTATYNPQWETVRGTRNPTSDSNDGWEFHGPKSKKPLSRTFRGDQGNYDGGGYILELGRTKRESESVLKYIKRTRWLDQRTRAVFIEFTLFNPNINKFVDVVLLIEQSPTWSFSLMSWITPIELIPIEDLRKSDEIAWFSVSLAFIIGTLIILTIMFIRRVIRTPFERLYPSMSFWLELIIIILVISSLCISIVRFVFAKEFSELVDTHPMDEYLSVQKAAFWNDVQRIMFSFAQAFVFIRIWQLLMFTDHRFLTFALTLKLTSKYLVGLVILMLIFISAFAIAGFFIFGQELWEFSSWSECIICLINQILSVKLFVRIGKLHPVYGPIYSFAFGFVMIFIALNFIIASLDVGVHEAKEVVHQRRVWLTYGRYFLEGLRRFVPKLQTKQDEMRSFAESNRTTLHPKRLYGMQVATIEFLQKFLINSKVPVMKEMEKHCNKLLAGTGYRVRNKKEKTKDKDNLKQAHIQQLRVKTIHFMRAKLGFDMTPKEFNEYASFNKLIVQLRIKKMERKVDELCYMVDDWMRANNYPTESSTYMSQSQSQDSSYLE